MTTDVEARHDVGRTLGWMDAGTATLREAVDRLSDADLDAPSRLPGWSRRHVLAHLARNAEALTRLLAWARTGIVTPMYVDARQRADEIGTSAAADPSQLREEFAATGDRLRADAAALTAEQWAATVRSARGRDIPAAEVPWMRVREVFLHAIDLDAGVGVADVPDDVARALVTDVTGFFAATAEPPAVRIESGGDTWSIGDGGPLVRGDVRDVAAWLTGRSDGDGLTAIGPTGADLPTLPAWL